jgi:hypothetical protein
VEGRKTNHVQTRPSKSPVAMCRVARLPALKVEHLNAPGFST